MNKKVLIIGGVAGGASTAARLRRLDEKAQIIILEKGPYVSFANCGLPYHIGQIIEDRDELILQTPESFKNRFNIEVRVNNEVTKINKEEKKVTITNHETNEVYEEDYDTLVISTGSIPLKPPIPGINSEGIFSLWTIPDMDKIISYVKKVNPKTAAIIGGGFIGLEMAENLEKLGIAITIVEMANQVMAPLDYDMAQIIHRHLVAKKVTLKLNDGVKSFERESGKTLITLQSGQTVSTDMVILSIGIRPNSMIVKEASLELNARGGVKVNEFLETSDQSIYAVGDVIEVDHLISHEKTMIPLAGPANKQGRICANNIMGKKEKYAGSMGSSVAKVFDMTVAATGLNEKQLNQSGKFLNSDYRVTIVHPGSHAGYYPGAFPMTLKVIFDLDGKVLGAQAVGYEGIDKRIDVIATVLKFNGTVYDMKELELTYAPPYSSAKDPVNMAGFSAENILNKSMDNILFNELASLDMNDTVILDARTPYEVSLGKIEGSYNIPVDELRERISELDPSKLIVVYCAVGFRAYLATRILMLNGFSRVRNLAGGYTTYSVVSADYNVTMEECAICEEDENCDVHSLNACGLACPQPLELVYGKINELKEGDILEIRATDPGFSKDIEVWCGQSCHTYLKSEKLDDSFVVRIKKGSPLK
ncbi:MAG: CoA-disulfide reductase [Clostridia bacterium]|nr:CoA-disulfide reductase [Clostridia bacterium]